MQKNSPNFIGRRLTEAREARGYNRQQVADALGITRQAISNYEKGDRTPTLETLDAAAKWLRFPIHRFSRPLPGPCDEPYFFRSFATATKTARVRAVRRSDWVKHDICGFLHEFVEMPSENFPKISPPDVLSIDLDDIEKLATASRRHWGLRDGPIDDLVLLLENNGAIVVRQELGARTLDAFSTWDTVSGRPYIILGTEKQSAVRSRWNAAHELGHMILHRHLKKNIVSQVEMHDILEEQAHQFAGAFLMPGETFGADLSSPSLTTFATIKTRWRTSIAAMIRRARNLGIISESDEERLFTYRSQRGWTKKEPYDDELLPERPKLIERGFDLLLREGAATKSGIESAVAMYALDIERAVGLEEGFLGDDTENLKFPGAIKANRLDSSLTTEH